MATLEEVSSLLDQGLHLDKMSHSIFMPVPDSEPPSPTTHQTKISIIGVGNVGMAIAATILTQGLADILSLVDANPEKLRGEMLDLQHAAAFLPRTKIHASTDYAVTANSDLVVIAASRHPKPGEALVDLLSDNLELFRDIVPKVVENSPETLLMVVSNPVDVLTYVAWKLSGFPPNRVVGSGTNLDSSRFRFLLADHLNVNAQDVQAYMVGEHGDNSIALWSSISICGVPLLSYLKDQTDHLGQELLEKVRKMVTDSMHEVLQLKGYTSWAIGYSVASLARSLLRDQRKIHPVSLLANGLYGISDDVFLSLPAQLGREGVTGVANVKLMEEEERKVRESAAALLEILNGLGI